MAAEEASPALAATSKPGDELLLDKIKSTPDGEPWECPCCGQDLPFQNLDWLDELVELLAKYAGCMGISPGLAGFFLVDKWRHYRFLKRKADQ